MCAAGFVAKAVREPPRSRARRRAREHAGRGAVHALRAARRPGRGLSRRQARRRRHAAGLLGAGAAVAGREGGADDRQRHFGGRLRRRGCASRRPARRPDAVLDERFVAAFTIAGNADDCRAQAAAYAAAGVTELALTFFGPSAGADMAYYRQGVRCKITTTASEASPRRRRASSARAPRRRISRPPPACRRPARSRPSGIFRSPRACAGWRWPRC